MSTVDPERPEGADQPEAAPSEANERDAAARAEGASDVHEVEKPSEPAPEKAAKPAKPSKPAKAPPSTPPSRAIRRGALAVLLVAFAAIALFIARAGDRIVMDQGVEFRSTTAPAEVVPGASAKLTFELHAEHALPTDYWFFVHIEAAHVESGRPDPCRVVADRAPDTPSSKWGDQTITHTVEVTFPASCRPGTFEVYAGLYDRKGWGRLKVLSPRTPDNRVHAATIEIVPRDADATPRKVTARAMILDAWWALLRPWSWWVLGVLAATILGLAIADRQLVARDGEGEDDAGAMSTLARRIAMLAPAVPFVAGILVVLEFVKDDAYISFRYAHNLVKGQGLVFNVGDKLEGYTNFLWVLILAPFEALGWDLFQVCEVLGTLLGIALLVEATRFTWWLGGARRDLSGAWASTWLATSSSLVLWAKSGLEQPLAQLLPIVGAFLLFRSREALAAPFGSEGGLDPQGKQRLERNHLLAGVVLGLGCLTRPELHAIALIVALPLVVDAIRTRRIAKVALLYAAGVLIVTIPAHAWRYHYYGTLFPNTFYVKTGTGAQIWKEGLKTLRDMFEFNATGALFMLAPLAFADRKRLVEKATMATVVVTFFVYYVKVGVDEMQWHRLYLPALPFVAVLASLGLRNLLDAIARLLGKTETKQAALAGAGWFLVAFAAFNSWRFTWKEFHGFDGHADLAGTYHPDLGKFIVRHERPGALVAFQDMGSTPYHAPDIDFLDFIGLVDGTVAHARHDHGLHPFVGVDENNQQSIYDASMREYYWKRNPEWAILTIYTPKYDEQRLAQAFERDPSDRALGDSFVNNSYQFDIWRDPRFRQRYVHVRTWQRSVGYYLSLWRRRDLWEQTPREVVLDAPPANLSGAKAKLENGLELLGSEITKETIERHEIFVTTWWKLPGKLPSDLTVFVHVSKEGYQAPGDHVPGDSMYPADRWNAGEILEDRTLFQLPITLRPGTYTVYVGFWRRSTGERVKVIEGQNDGENRISLGTFTVRPFRPMLDQLIPPTRVEVMRKYPDRIPDHHRKPGT
jgi:hypothetical protein